MRYGENYFNVPRRLSYFMGFNHDLFPVDDVRLRRALVLVIDRAQLVRDLAWHHLTPAHGSWIPHEVPGHSPDIGLEYNPVLARRLLAEAGYSGGRGFPELEMVLLDTPLNRELGKYLATLWQEELGITIRPGYLAMDPYIERLQPVLPAIRFGGWEADYPDPETFLWAVTRQLSDERVHQILNEARRATEQEKRLALYRQADKLLIEEAIIMPHTYGLGHYFVSPRVRKFPKTRLWRDIIVDPD
jgi:ABC-type transport system substrate-binding protein